jgi:hypothetical protein
MNVSLCSLCTLNEDDRLAIRQKNIGNVDTGNEQKAFVDRKKAKTIVIVVHVPNIIKLLANCG